MKFIIEGSQRELTELIKRFGGIETEAKKEELPSLLTELAEDEKINELADAIRNADKENAPQSEATEQKKNKEIFEKQLELLSQASKDCLLDISLYQHLAPLTQAMLLIEYFRV